MEIPVSGIPISVTRTYDTLTAQTRDDFGFGWRLEFRHTDLRTSLGTDTLYEKYGVRAIAFSDGERVYLTAPADFQPPARFLPPRSINSVPISAVGDRSVSAGVSVPTGTTDGRRRMVRRDDRSCPAIANDTELSERS